jgi:hypothetical protein
MPKPVAASPWSFSKMKDFQTCPKQFYHKTVLQEFPYVETPEMRYGTEFHKAAELFIRDGVPVPDKFAFARGALEHLKAQPGEKHCERKLGLTEDLQPCSFFDKAVWFRGVVDLAIIDGETATVIDYKSGKNARYADKGQLELMAMAMFRHFPEIRRVRAGLLFVIANELVKDKYAHDTQHKLWEKWLADYGRMQTAFETNTWNPKPSGLCRNHCPVKSCPHFGA